MPKTSRRSVPYGALISPKNTPKRFLEYIDTLTVRELSFADGGIGCGLWNASIILSKFILTHPHIFTGKIVHEVGAGVGIPCLYASLFCKRAICSDYLTPLIDNFDYNVNCNVNSWSTSNVVQNNCPELSITSPIQHHFRKLPLWQSVYRNQLSIQKRIEDEENDEISTQPLIDYPMIDLHQFDTNLNEPNEFIPNICLDHHFDPNDPTQIQCQCIGYCPPITYPTYTATNNLSELLLHRNQCLNNMQSCAQGIVLDWLQFHNLPQQLQYDLKCDIILGSEVSYPTILDTLPSLVYIINQTLSLYGAFYLVQSPNRGTSIYFIEELCGKLGFLLDMRVVDLTILDEFNSGQRSESYVYYTFRRPLSPYPIMGIENDYVKPVDGLSKNALALINTNKNKILHDGTIIQANEIIFQQCLAEPVLTQNNNNNNNNNTMNDNSDSH